VLVPGKCVVGQRLAKPKVIEPRQPLRLGVKLVEAERAGDRERAIVEVAAQLDIGRLILERIELADEVLF
jgi:hypothetical protein